MVRLSSEEEAVFAAAAGDMLQSEIVRQMRGFIQHGTMSTYDHCVDVSRMSLKLARILHADVDEQALCRGALLHDFYLYDWHDGKPERRYHGFTHPGAACRNARRYFHAGRKEQAMIRTHMWPFTLFHVPGSKEAWILCLADKYCSASETVTARLPRFTL